MTYTDDRPPAATYDDTPPWEPHEDPGVLAYATPGPRNGTSRANVDRQPPQDLAAEQAVLGAMLTTPAAIDAVEPELDPSDFWRPSHELLYNQILTLHSTGTPVDIVTIGSHLATQPAGGRGRGTLLDTIGGAGYLQELTAACPLAIRAPEYAKTVRDTARLRQVVATGTRLMQLGQEGDVGRVDAYLGEALQVLDDTVQRFGPRTHAGPSTWTPLDLDLVLDGQEVDPPPAVCARADGQKLFYRGAVHSVSGEPGSGKTWLTLIAAVQELALGHLVVMVDFEDRASRVVGRLLALGATPTQIRDYFRYIRPHNALDTTTWHDLEHATLGASLIVLDGVTEAMTLHGLDLSSNPDIAKFYSLLPRRLADLRTHDGTDIGDQGPAVVMIDHVVKDTEKQGRWGIGGQHKLAGIDGVSYLVKIVEPFGRGKSGHARITVAKDRPGYIEEIAVGRTVVDLHVDGTDPVFIRADLRVPDAISVDDAGDMRPTYLMEKVSRWLEIQPNAKRDDIVTSVAGKNEYVRRGLDRLIQEGFIEVEQVGRTRFHRVVTPFRNDPDDRFDYGPTYGHQDTPIEPTDDPYDAPRESA